jgi:hypothetical protein
MCRFTAGFIKLKTISDERQGRPSNGTTGAHLIEFVLNEPARITKPINQRPSRTNIRFKPGLGSCFEEHRKRGVDKGASKPLRELRAGTEAGVQFF